MLAKAIMTFGTVGVGGYCVVTALNYDATIYPKSLEETAAILKVAKSETPRVDGDGMITISTTGRTDNRLHMVVDNFSTKPMKCDAVLEPLKPNETKVALDCSASDDGKKPLDALETETRVIWFKEHISAIGEARAFDRARVFAAVTGLLFKNMGSMVSDASKAMAKASMKMDELKKMSSDSGSSSKIDWDKPIERDRSYGASSGYGYGASSSSLSRTEAAIEEAEAEAAAGSESASE